MQIEQNTFQAEMPCQIKISKRNHDDRSCIEKHRKEIDQKPNHEAKPLQQERNIKLKAQPAKPTKVHSFSINPFRDILRSASFIVQSRRLLTKTSDAIFFLSRI